MADVKIFKRKNNQSTYWDEVVERLAGTGFVVHSREEDADISIALCGKFENPLALKGKRVLFYDEKAWQNTWPMYEFIMDAYYDEMINITGMSDDKKVSEIINYIREAEHETG